MLCKQLLEHLVCVVIADAAGKLLIRLTVGLYPLLIALRLSHTLIVLFGRLAETGHSSAQHYHAHYR